MKLLVLGGDGYIGSHTATELLNDGHEVVIVDSLVTGYEKAREILGWEPEIKDLADIISSAWKWHQTHPNGYDK